MNCQDVALILDDRDTGALDVAERRAMDAHLAICPDCARDWQIHTRLVAARVPALPAELPLRLRSLVTGRQQRPLSWRMPGRLLLFGGLFAAGAAAALLVDRLLLAPAPSATLMPAAQPVPVAPQQVAPPAAITPVASRTTGALSPPAGRTGTVAAAVRIQVMPLLNQATAEAVAAVDATYQAFVAGLGAVPGVIVVPNDSSASAAEPAAYQLTIRGIGPLPEGKFRVGLDIADRTPEGTYRMSRGFMHFGDLGECITPGFPVTTSMCSGPAAVAAQQLATVRTTLLMPSLQPSTPEEKSRLLLRSSTSPDPRIRASAWRSARGLRQPELVQPLIDALLHDRDENASAHAAAALAADYGDDPRVRTALEAAARGESRPMLRAFVQQTLAGGDAWNAYIIDTLKDAGRSGSERLEPLLLALEQPASAKFDLEGLLRRHAAIETVTSLVSGIDPWPRNNQMAMLLTRLSLIEHPAVATLLVENLDRFGKALVGSNLVYLLARHGSDPRVRAALEKISASDPDPYVRQNAADTLKKLAAGAVQSPMR